MDSITKCNNMMSCMKILYIDESRKNRNIVKKSMDKKVGKLFFAENGVEGLKIFKLQNPDIIITELDIDGLNGIELIREIRRVDYQCGIIVVSKIDDIHKIIEVVGLGIDKYLIKPIDESKINYAIEKVIIKVGCRLNRDYLRTKVIANYERKKSIEATIEREFCGFLKNNLGKGPKNIEATILGDIIEINVYEMLTLMEQELLVQEDYIIVEHYRLLFYQNKSMELKGLISNIIKMDINIEDIKVNVLKNMEKIKVKICSDNII